MKERIKQYIEGNIKIKELETLQRDVESMSDNALNEYIDKLDDGISFSQMDINNIQTKINDEINLTQRKKAINRLYITCAASIIPIIFIFGFIILNKNKSIDQYKSILAQEIEIKTNNGEYITTILPDGSRVSMGPKSSLSYLVGQFSNKERIIQYFGEGDFEITNIPNSTFILYSQDFKIQVLGTEFSIFSRSDNPNSEIYLDKGSIQLMALASNACRIMSPGETAIIDKFTGDIQLYDANSNIKKVAGQGIMYFMSSPLNDVADQIELYYGYNVTFEHNKRDILFTGSLPTHNIKQAAYILENTLNIEITIDDIDKQCIIK